MLSYPLSFVQNPLLPLVVTFAIFKATLDGASLDPKDKNQVTKAYDYLSKRLVTILVLVDKSKPTVAALCDAIPCGKGGRFQRPGRTLLLILTMGLAAESDLLS